MSAKINLGALALQYRLYQDQLPKPLPLAALSPIDSVDVRLAEDVLGISNAEFEIMAFVLPCNQVVLAVVSDFTTRAVESPDSVGPIKKVLDLGIEGRFTIGGVDLAEYVKGLAAKGLEDRLGPDGEPVEQSDLVLLPERHQLVFITPRHQDEPVPGPGVVNRILYRDTPPYTEEFARPKNPTQLNPVRQDEGLAAEGRSTQMWSRFFRSEPQEDDRLLKLGVVTPYVSLLFGHKPYVDASIFLSTVHAVGTATRFRQIWHESYRQVRQFRDNSQQERLGEQKRDDLERLADGLGNLEFDLTFSVEFPLMRIETFQTALYEAMDLSTQTTLLSQMFNQLGGSIRSEITAIDVRERHRSDARKRWNAFAASILSLLGVSVGFVIAFLGTNTLEVPSEPELSIWDQQFAMLFFLAALFALTPVFLILIPYLRDWPWLRQRLRALWCGSGLTVAGVGLFVATIVELGIDLSYIKVVDAVARALALFTTGVGVTVIGMWLLRVIDRKRRKSSN